MYQKETPLLIKRSSRFKKNLLEEYKKIKTIDDKIRDQKLQYDKKDELKQIEGIFPQNLLNDLIRDKLKEVVSLQDIIKIDKQFCC